MRNVAVLPPVKDELHAVLLNLAAFKNYTTEGLIAMAHALPGGMKVHIPDRLTAIVLLLGTRPLGIRGESSPGSHLSYELALDCRGR
jgi:hypothetical protein